MFLHNVCSIILSWSAEIFSNIHGILSIKNLSAISTAYNYLHFLTIHFLTILGSEKQNYFDEVRRRVCKLCS